MKIFFSLALLFALVASTNAACDAGTFVGHKYANFQDTLGAHFRGHVTMNQMFLLGSHDAGTYPPLFQTPFGQQASWAITQKHNLEYQLCSGVRVFDVRFKRHGAGHADWRIFHGSFLFERMADFAAHVNTFCNNAAHKHETIILRVKVSDGRTPLIGSPNDAAKTDRQAFMRAFATAIDDTCIVKRTIPNAAQNTFGGLNINAIKALDVDANKANVFLMPYGKHFEGLTSDVEYARRVWPYGVNMAGKSSESLKVSKVCKGQRKKYNTWYGNKQGKMFGWWMTMTGGVGHLNVDRNSEKLYDNGKYGDWIKHFVRDTTAHHADGLNGVVVWTDWGGSRSRFLNLQVVMERVNQNIDAGRAFDDGVGNGGPNRLVYTFLEETASLRTSSRQKTLQRLLSTTSRTTNDNLVICADKTDEEKPESPNCIQDRIIPNDLFDDCEEGKNILEILKDEKAGFCALCGDESKVSFLAECAENSEHKDTWKAVETKLKCCDFKKVTETPAAKKQKEELKHKKRPDGNRLAEGETDGKKKGAKK